MKRLLVLMVAVGFVLVSRPLVAGTMEYSWEGTLVPDVPGIDPWNIGAAGKPFFISATVDENAVDSDSAVPGAFFRNPAELVLRIDGQPAIIHGIEFVIGDIEFGGIQFRESASDDDIGIALNGVEFNGVTEESFRTGVLLPASTFTLTNVFETPPVFLTTLTIGGIESSGVRSSYCTTTDKGILVPIPEPSALVLALLALSVLGTRMFWRRLSGR